MKIQKLAAIDIGSNAARLLFVNVIRQNGETIFKKSALTRVPLRLGFDSFTKGKINPERKSALVNTMQAFSFLMKAHGIEHYRACATSAMREASNGQNIIQQIKEQANIEIEIISGKEEAEIIFQNKEQLFNNSNRNYLFMDVGGGSTELTFFSNQQAISSKSFNIGTIRLLKEMDTNEAYGQMKAWVKRIEQEYNDIEIIGSGGNINKTHKLLNKKEEKPIYVYELKIFHNHLKSTPYDDRISKMGLNPDRADVLVPAQKLFLKVAKWSRAHVINVPKIGIADGIVRKLYFDLKKDN